MLPSALTSFLVSLLNILTPSRIVEPSPAPPTLQFELRHLHAVSRTAHVVFSDVKTQTLHTHSNSKKQPDTSYTIQPRRILTFRPPSFEAFSNARNRSLTFGQSEHLRWDEDEVIGPDVEKRKTLLELAKMTNNAYVDPDDPAWYELGSGWKSVSRSSRRQPQRLMTRVLFQDYPFGWEPDADGFRGHVFATPDNKTVVLSIKGTSAGVFGGGGPTVKKDKINDNLLFSCCCARIDWSWTTVCGCYRNGWKCNQVCLERALIKDSLFYPIGTASGILPQILDLR